MFITFDDLAGIGFCVVVVTLLLVLVGFFPLTVLLWVGAMYAATVWRARQ